MGCKLNSWIHNLITMKLVNITESSSFDLGLISKVIARWLWQGDSQYFILSHGDSPDSVLMSQPINTHRPVTWLINIHEMVILTDPHEDRSESLSLPCKISVLKALICILLESLFCKQFSKMYLNTPSKGCNGIIA